MKKYLFIILFFSFHLKAELDQEILIQGKIGNFINTNEARVIDSHNQVYFLPKSVFPKSFNFSQGEPFSIEISIELYKSLEIKNIK